MPKRERHRNNAIEAAGELLALSNHLAGRMGEGALAHMEGVALRILNESGVRSLHDGYYPVGRTAGALQTVVDASTALVTFLFTDDATASSTEEQYEAAFAEHAQNLVNALIQLGAVTSVEKRCK